MGKRTLITGTLILTFASLITRVLGFIFRVYMSNLMGAEGIGLYQLIFPIYMLIWAASSAGISLAVSKKVAEFSAKGLHQDGIKTLRVALCLSLGISCFLSLLVFIFAPFIATSIIHEPRTELALRYLCYCIPFMAASCCIKGYFQGKQQMSVPAICQIGEQVARMAVIYLLAGLFVPKGIEYACALGAIGLCGGEVISFLFGYILYLLKKRSLPFKKSTYSYHSLFSTIMTISIPLTANRFLTSSLASIENILIPLQLQRYGLSSSSALSTYGMISGMAAPLLFFPSMVTMSISMVLVPAISEAVATHNKRSLTKTISKSIQLTTFIGIGASALFLSLGNEIAMACYNLKEVGYLLRLLAIICPFIYLQNIFTGMLNGLGLQKLTFKGNIFASALCIILTVTLIPRFGVAGYMLAILAQSVFATLYDLVQVLRNTYVLVDIRNWIVKPLLSAVSSCVFMRFVHQMYLVPTFSLRIATLLACLVLASLYGLFLLLFGAITKEDIQMVLR
jgi:stage V sporulation protein B